MSTVEPDYYPERDDSLSSASSSKPDVRDSKERYLAWYETRYGPLREAWPETVGDEVGRATAIVRFCSPYYVVTVPFKSREVLTWEADPLRVVFYLDAHGYVARTPRVG